MFTRCPHCGFLVALIAARATPRRCPQCHGLVEPGASRAVPMVEDDSDTEAATAAMAAQAAVDEGEITPTPDAAPDDSAEPVSDAAPDEGIEPVSDAAPDDGVEPTSDAAPDDDVEPVSNAVPDDALAPEPEPERQPPSPAATPAPPAPPGFARTRGSRLHSAPSFARRSISMVEAGPRWPGIAIIVALVALLVLQSLLAQRAELATQAKWRPTLNALCTVLRCSLPAWREPAAFAMLNRSVRPSPTHPGVLEITATFRNDARWAQPWPTLLLTLSDLDGQTVGARAFQPRDYRDGRVIGDTLEPGQSTTVLLDVIEPAPNVVAFTFDFH